jgi:hypothetical protein
MVLGGLPTRRAVRDIVADAHFYRPAHATICRALAALGTDGTPGGGRDRQQKKSEKPNDSPMAHSAPSGKRTSAADAPFVRENEQDWFR